MTTVVLFHSVLGIRQGELDAADRLRADGHEVVLPDLLDGRVFDGYEPAMTHARSIGMEALFGRGLAAVADVPDGFVVAGFSQSDLFGKGLAAGFAIVLLGVLLDRTTQAAARRSSAGLHHA